MMAEYIERRTGVSIFRAKANMAVLMDAAPYFEKAAQMLEKLPAADVAPVRHGRWQYNTDFYVWCCSECGENPHKGTGVVVSEENLPAYCPHCGAKMGGAE
jgi:rubrerythrin